MIFTKEDASVSDEQGEVLSRYYNIHYRACVVSLVYISSKKVDSCFAVHKLEKCHRIPVKYTLRVWYTFLIYIRDNKNLGLRYYAKIEDAALSDIFIQAN